METQEKKLAYSFHATKTCKLQVDTHIVAFFELFGKFREGNKGIFSHHIWDILSQFFRRKGLGSTSMKYRNQEGLLRKKKGENILQRL